MSTDTSNIIRVIVSIDRAEMSRRGKLGAAARAERHDCSLLARKAARTFLNKLSPDERREHFSALGRRSAEVRRARVAAAVDGSTR
jgi:hypothetical protein